ncbi:MAG: oligosaccharide flippase family protein [Anaerolineae bacterium]
MDALMGQMRVRLSGLWASVPAQASAWYVAGSALQKGLDLLIAPVFLVLLTPEQYGLVSVFLTWMTIFAMLLPLRADASIGRALFEEDTRHFARFRSAVLGLGWTVGLVALAVLGWLPDTLTLGLFQLPRDLVVLAGGSALILFTLEVTWQGWLYTYRYRLYTLTNLGLGIGQIVLSLVLIGLLPGRLPGVDAGRARVLGIVLAGVPLAVIFAAQTVSQGRALFRRADWRYALAYSVPLLPHLLAGLLLSQYDRVLISQYAGLAQAGIYSFAYLIASVVFMVWKSLNRAWGPWAFARLQAGELAVMRRRARQYLLGMAALTAGLMISVPPVLRWIIPPDYHAGLPLIPVVMSGVFFLLPYSFYSTVTFYAKQTGLLSVATVLAMAVNLGLNVWLIPRYGFAAAAWATVAGYAVMFGLHVAVVRYGLRRRGLFDFWLIVGVSGGLVAFAAVLSAVLAA